MYNLCFQQIILSFIVRLKSWGFARHVYLFILLILIIVFIVFHLACNLICKIVHKCNCVTMKLKSSITFVLKQFTYVDVNLSIILGHNLSKINLNMSHFRYLYLIFRNNGFFKTKYFQLQLFNVHVSCKLHADKCCGSIPTFKLLFYFWYVNFTKNVIQIKSTTPTKPLMASNSVFYDFSFT